jgi:hypothetical protein
METRVRAGAIEIAGGLLVGLVLFGAAMAGALALRSFASPQVSASRTSSEVGVNR